MNLTSGLGSLGGLMGGLLGGGSRSSSSSNATNSLNLSFNPNVLAVNGMANPSAGGYATGSPSGAASANSSGADSNPLSSWFPSTSGAARSDISSLSANQRAALGGTAATGSTGDGTIMMLMLGVAAIFLLSGK